MDTKRSISRQEKATCVKTSDYGLVFLGDKCPEISELIDIGFTEQRLIGVDRTAENIAYCQTHYPGVNLFNTEFSRFWRNHGSTLSYSYVHLDCCGQATPAMLSSAITTLSQIVVGGRLRVTYSGSFARLNRMRNECFLLEEVVDYISKGGLGRVKLLGARNYTSSLSHKEPYFTAWWEKTIDY